MTEPSSFSEDPTAKLMEEFMAYRKTVEEREAARVKQDAEKAKSTLR